MHVGLVMPLPARACCAASAVELFAWIGAFVVARHVSGHPEVVLQMTIPARKVAAAQDKNAEQAQVAHGSFLPEQEATPKYSGCKRV